METCRCHTWMVQGDALGRYASTTASTRKGLANYETN